MKRKLTYLTNNLHVYNGAEGYKFKLKVRWLDTSEHYLPDS